MGYWHSSSGTSLSDGTFSGVEVNCLDEDRIL